MRKKHKWIFAHFDMNIITILLKKSKQITDNVKKYFFLPFFADKINPISLKYYLKIIAKWKLMCYN